MLHEMHPAHRAKRAKMAFRRTARTNRSQPRRLLAASVIAVAALAGPAAGQALAIPGHFSISDEHIVEGTGGTQLMNFTITYQRNDTTTPSTGTVSWTTQDGTATAGNDYVAKNGFETLTTTQTAAQPGGSHQTAVISVPIIGDSVPEGREFFHVRLYGAGTPAALIPPGYSTDIVKDDGIGTIDEAPAPAATTPPPPIDDHDTSPVIITVPAPAPQLPPQPQPQLPPQPQPQPQPINVIVPGAGAGQSQVAPVPQTIVQQLPATQAGANHGPADEPVEDDHTGPTMGMQFHRLTSVARVRLTCPAAEESCSGRILLQLSGKTLGSARFDIAGGASSWVSVRLTRSERRALRRVAGFYFRAIALDAAGNRETTTRGFQV
jgi:hypothetical protein